MDYFLAIRLNRPIDVAEIIKTEPCKQFSVSKDGFNGLQLACKYGFTEIVTILLDSGIDIEAVDQKYQRSCLHWASICGYNDIILMLYRDASPLFHTILNKIDKAGQTSLMLACKGGRLETVKLLLAMGADITVNMNKINSAPLTVLDMCNGSMELKSVLQAYAQQIKQHTGIPSTHKDISDNELVWGLADSLDFNVDKLSGGRSKLILKGWLLRCPSSSGSSNNNNNNNSNNNSISNSNCNDNSSATAITIVPIINLTDHSNYKKEQQLVEVIVKLSQNCKELKQEIDNRVLFRSKDKHSCISEIVTTQHDFVLTLRQNIGTSSPLWYGILLEKGIIDLHRLYDAMAQKATVSRLHDLSWKLHLIATLCIIAREFSQRGLVWYDLKPSNFIVCVRQERSSEHREATGRAEEGKGRRLLSSSILTAAATTTTNNSSTSSSTSSGNSTTISHSSTPSPISKSLLTDAHSSGLHRYAPSSYETTTKTHKWLQQSDWNLSNFTLKATDLAAIYPNDTMVLKDDISCTVRFLCPSLAKVLSTKNEQYVTVNHAHMQWSLAMTALQLLHTDNQSFWSSLSISIHSEDVYSYLCEDDLLLQSLLYDYIDHSIQPILQGNRHCESIIQSLKATLCVADAERLPLCCDSWFDY